MDTQDFGAFLALQISVVGLAKLRGTEPVGLPY